MLSLPNEIKNRLTNTLVNRLIDRMCLARSTNGLSVFARFVCLAGFIVLICSTGCGTTTQRVGTEQLLLSDAVDEAVSQIDFSTLKGETVYLDQNFINGIKTNSVIDARYVISSLHQQLSASGALIQESRKTARVIVEPRIGALGTDGHDVTFGLPQSGAISSAANVLSGSPIPAIPEISFGRSDAQAGIAKIIVFAYDRETREPIWQSGIAKAESTSSNTWVLGAGPFQKGTIHEGYRFAGTKFLDRSTNSHPTFAERDGVAYHQPHVFHSEKNKASVAGKASDQTPPANTSTIRQASHEEEIEEAKAE